MKKVYRKFEVIKMLELFKKAGFSDIGQTIEMLNKILKNDTDAVFEFDFKKEKKHNERNRSSI